MVGRFILWLSFVVLPFDLRCWGAGQWCSQKNIVTGQQGAAYKQFVKEFWDAETDVGPRNICLRFCKDQPTIWYASGLFYEKRELKQVNKGAVVTLFDLLLPQEDATFIKAVIEKGVKDLLEDGNWVENFKRVCLSYVNKLEQDYLSELREFLPDDFVSGVEQEIKDIETEMRRLADLKPVQGGDPKSFAGKLVQKAFDLLKKACHPEKLLSDLVHTEAMIVYALKDKPLAGDIVLGSHRDACEVCEYLLCKFTEQHNKRGQQQIRVVVFSKEPYKDSYTKHQRNGNVLKVPLSNPKLDGDISGYLGRLEMSKQLKRLETQLEELGKMIGPKDNGSEPNKSARTTVDSPYLQKVLAWSVSMKDQRQLADRDAERSRDDAIEQVLSFRNLAVLDALRNAAAVNMTTYLSALSQIKSVLQKHFKAADDLPFNDRARLLFLKARCKKVEESLKKKIHMAIQGGNAYTLNVDQVEQAETQKLNKFIGYFNEFVPSYFSVQQPQAGMVEAFSLSAVMPEYEQGPETPTPTTQTPQLEPQVANQNSPEIAPHPERQQGQPKD